MTPASYRKETNVYKLNIETGQVTYAGMKMQVPYKNFLSQQ